MSVPEELLAFQLRAMNIPHEREFAFCPGRRWRADFRIRDVLIEVEGGGWTGGRHVRGAGFEADCEKYAEAVALGYRVLRVTPGMVHDGSALDYVRRILRKEKTHDPRIA